MKTLYIECNMGAAGDMLMAALLELHENPDDFLERLNKIGLPGVEVRAGAAEKCGLVGTQVSVKIHGQEEETEDLGHGHSHRHDHHGHHEHSHDHDHADHHEHSHDDHHHHDHSSLHAIEHLLENLQISQKVRDHALAVYNLIAQAESESHGLPLSQVHFHEVGSLDAVADIVGVSMLIEELAPEKILASPVHVGSGQVKCSHGILPVPAPATARILKDVPIYGGGVSGELCTPTGAALLKHFVEDFIPMPLMKVEKTAYGMGKKDFASANCVRLFWGQTESNNQEVVELVCNIDDMTAEDLAFAQEELFREGALDVYLTSISMKKNRLAYKLSCMCNKDEKDKFVSLIFKHTTTLGMREIISKRHVLSRSQEERESKLGKVTYKVSQGYGQSTEKAEYEDLARLARENKLSLAQVRALLDEKN